MSGIGSTGGATSVDSIMALRQQILERNDALSRASTTVAAPASSGATSGAASFADTLSQALQGVNQGQQAASDMSDAYERGQTTDIAKVMLARQSAQVGFEATMQVRNKLLSAYQNIMSMPV